MHKTAQAPVIKAEGKSKMLNANARMGRHHKRIGLHKMHAKPHIAIT